MKLYAQHGAHAGEKIQLGLEHAILDGVIFGAKDIRPQTLVDKLSQLSGEFPEADLMLDPQYYATLLAGQPGVRLGYLVGDPSYAYFSARRRQDLERESRVQRDLRSVLEYQAGLPVTAAIAPNIVIRRSFDSIEGTIAKRFLGNAAEVWRSVGDDRPVYATVAISNTALNNFDELQVFLQEITELEDPPDGLYLLLEKGDSDTSAYLTEPDVLSRWMFLNYSLRINGLEAINGYTDALIPYIAASGASSFATGWYNTQKNFSLKKFEPTSGFARRPVSRYMSRPLLKSIRANELDDLREMFEIMNELPCDDLYDQDDGSSTDSNGEALQNWEALRSMSELSDPEDTPGSLASCREALDTAEALYVAIQNYGYTLRDRSSRVHLDLLREELDAFEELAEI
jgi:hypothetical protein